MTIYLLYDWYNYDQKSIYGIYSSREKAVEEIKNNLDKYMEHASSYDKHLTIEEFADYKIEVYILDEQRKLDYSNITEF